jgi:hypothetical protein
MRGRHLAALLLALPAALMWAPLSVSAAPLNTLSAPNVSPPGGDTTTVFTFSVRYLSLAETVADSVSVTVAGRVVGLSLTNGTGIDGTWTGSSRLPAGSWGTQFSALPVKGPKPSLAGPMLTVIAASPTAGPSGSSAPSSADLPDRSSAPSAQPSQVSTPNATGHASSSTPPAAVGQAAGSSPSASSGSAAGSGTAPGAAAGSGDTHAQPRPPPRSSSGAVGTRANGMPSSSGSGRASVTQTGSPGARGQTNDASGRGSPDVGLYAALVLAAGVLACLVLLVSWRSRDDERTTPVAVTPVGRLVRPGPGGTTPAPGAEPQPDIPLRRITARQRIPADDPILTAMGLDPRAPASSGAAALKARRTTRGPRVPISDPEPGEHAGGDQNPNDRSGR